MLRVIIGGMRGVTLPGRAVVGSLRTAWEQRDGRHAKPEIWQGRKDIEKYNLPDDFGKSQGGADGWLWQRATLGRRQGNDL
jgi:hypothetical protein